LKTILAGNWKMHKTPPETAAFFATFLAQLPDAGADAEIVVAPPFTSLPIASEYLRDSSVKLGAQTMHWELQGAFTGEISASMLLACGVSYVILGHSERRAYCDETDRTVNLKVQTALAQDITPIVAVGETAEQRHAGETDTRVVGQIQAAFAGVAHENLRRVVVAYEPIWAIGTGKNCDPAEADRVMALMRNAVEGLAGVPILYGGSMNASNVAAYMECPNINGGLIGGASLDPTGFAQLIKNAIHS
jgi:triosephosphate isomerase